MADEQLVPRWTTEPYDPDDETLVPPEGDDGCDDPDDFEAQVAGG